ncbi:hypothetical protein JCM3774_000176 [Rhodotorula dairenensis]
MEVVPTDVPAMQAPQWVANYSMGPQTMGEIGQVLLLGVFTTLFCHYAVSGELKRHRLLGRVALWTSLVLNWGYTGLCVYELYVGAVSQNRTSAQLVSSNTAWQLLPFLAGTIGVVTQSFLTSHALVLIPRKALRLMFSAVMALLVAAQAAGFTMACANGILFVQGKDAIPGLGFNDSLSMWLWTSAGADLLISTVCAFSIRQRLSGYTRETDTVIIKLAVICFRTAAYTAFMSLTGAILATVFSGDFDLRSFTGFSFWLMQPALYGVSLFTFSKSSRRVVEPQPRLSVETAAVAGGGGGGRRVVECKPTACSYEPRRPYPSISRSHSTAGSANARRPLAIRVECERVVSIDEPEYPDLDLGEAGGEQAASPVSASSRSQLKPPLPPPRAQSRTADVLDMV